MTVLTTNQDMMKATILLTMTALAVAGCKNASEPDRADAPPAEPALEALLLAGKPEGAVSISEARAKHEPGTPVVLAGKIMGRDDPFVEDRAMVVLGDPARLTSCDLRPGDNCKTPWDVCCDEPEVIRQSIATVQVVNDDGSLVKHGLRGLGGMKELSSLVVKGTVAEGSNPDNLIVNAEAIHVAAVEPAAANPAD